jgi:hypothetical protein
MAFSTSYTADAQAKVKNKNGVYKVKTDGKYKEKAVPGEDYVKVKHKSGGGSFFSRHFTGHYPKTKSKPNKHKVKHANGSKTKTKHGVTKVKTY